MILEGKIDVAVPAAKAWDFLIDVNRFASCVPGLEQVTQIDERTFDGVVRATVGPISGNVTFRSTILDSAPLSEMVVQTDGTDSVTRSAVSAKLLVRLNETIENRTELSYHADIAVKGRLAILGDMVLRATGALMLEEFTKRLKEKLEGASGLSNED
jgi:carbon monoxide dehydrogenase subunit G